MIVGQSRTSESCCLFLKESVCDKTTSAVKTAHQLFLFTSLFNFLLSPQTGCYLSVRNCRERKYLLNVGVWVIVLRRNVTLITVRVEMLTVIACCVNFQRVRHIPLHFRFACVMLWRRSHDQVIVLHHMKIPYRWATRRHDSGNSTRFDFIQRLRL